MFEQAIANILRKLLGKYVEGGSILGEKLQLGVWSGNIVFEHLVLKKEILDASNAPLALSYGSIGKLDIQIPWKNLGGDPIIVNIDRVLFLLEPKYEWNPNGADLREQAIKQAKLVANELFTGRNKLSEDIFQGYKDYAKKWLFESIINRVIENIEVTVRDIHIRYEDHVSCPGDFCVGLTLESFHANSRNHNSFPADISQLDIITEKSDKVRNFEQTFVEANCIQKVVEVRHLSFYWSPLKENSINIATTRFAGRSHRDIESLMLRSIPRQVHVHYDRPLHHFILFPMDVEVMMDIIIDPVGQSFKTLVKAIIPNVSICIEDRQFREIISLSSNMSSFIQLGKLSGLRPRVSVVENPRLWWRYAYNAVLKRLRASPKFNLTWDRLKLRRMDRLVYVELWKWILVNQGIRSFHSSHSSSLSIMEMRDANYRGSKLFSSILSEYHSAKRSEQMVSSQDNSNSSKYNFKDVIDLIAIMEFHYSYEDILYFRSIAELSIPSKNYKQGWVGGILSWANLPNRGESNANKEIYSFSSVDDKVSDRVDSDDIKSLITISVIQCSFTLGLSAPVNVDFPSQATSWNSIRTCLPFLEIESFGLSVGASILGERSHSLIQLSLHNMEAYEVISDLTGNKPQNHYNRLISRKLRSSASSSPRPSAQKQTDRHVTLSQRYPLLNINNFDALQLESFKNLIGATENLFQAELDLTPYDRFKEVSVKLDLQELEALVSPAARWVNCLTTFASWPEDVEYWSEMEMNAMNQLASIKSRLEAKLDFMMHKHKNIVLEANIKAPLIVICSMKDDIDDIDEVSDMVVIDLGYIKMRTEKLAKAIHEKALMEKSKGSIFNDDFVADAPSSPEAIISISRPGSPEFFDPAALDALSSPEQGNRTRHSSWAVASTVNTFNTDFENENDAALYDTISVSISQIEVFITDTVSWKGNSLKKAVVVDKFDLNIDIQVSVLPWDTTLPPAKLSIDLPEIHIQLSDELLYRLGMFQMKLAGSSRKLLEFQRNKLDKFEIANKSLKYDRSSGLTLRYDDDVSDEDEFFDPSNLSNGEFRRVVHGRSNSMGSDSSRRSKHIIESNKRLSDDDCESASSRVSSRKHVSIASQSSFRSYNASSPDGFDDDISDCSDDSFVSANGELFEEGDLTCKIDDLQKAMKQKETLKTKLIANIRIAENDQAKRELFDSLMEDLNTCEAELHDLRVQFVEMNMLLGDFNINTYQSPIKADGSSGINIDESDFLKTLFLDSGTPDEYHQKKMFMKSSFFKPRPDQLRKTSNRRGIGGNKEIIHLTINISSFIVELKCDPSGLKDNTHVCPLTEFDSTGHLKFRLGGVSLKAKHRALDSKVTLVLRDFDIEDIKVSDVGGGMFESTSLYVMSSEPSVSGVPLFQSKFGGHSSCNLLSLKYDVKFGYDNDDGSRSEEEPATISAKHSIRVHGGYLGMYIEQSVVVMLLSMVHRVLFTIKANSTVLNDIVGMESSTSSSSLDSISKPTSSTKSSSISVISSIRGKGMSISLLERGRPLITFSTQSLNCGLQLSSTSFHLALRLVDLSLFYYHYSSNHPSVRAPDLSKRYIVFGKKSGNIDPFFSLSCSVDNLLGTKDLKLKMSVAPFFSSISTLLVNDVLTSILYGDSMKFFSSAKGNDLIKRMKKSQSNIPRSRDESQSSSSSLDSTLELLLLSCNGTVSISIGESEISFPCEVDLIQERNRHWHGVCKGMIVDCSFNSNSGLGSTIKFVDLSIGREKYLVNPFGADINLSIFKTMSSYELVVNTFVSPIIVEVDENEITSIGIWVRNFISTFSKSLGNYVAINSAAPKSNVVVDNSSTSRIGVLFPFSVSVKMAEISLILSANTNNFRRSSTNSRFRTHPRQELIDAYTPMFQFSFHDFESRIVSVRSQFSAPLSLNIILSSVNFSHRKKNGCKSLFLNSIISDNLHEKSMSINIELLEDFSVRMMTNVAQLKVTFSQEAISALLILCSMYSGCFFSSGDTMGFIEMEEGLKQVAFLKKRKSIRPSAEKMVIAHPLSIPLAKPKDHGSSSPVSTLTSSFYALNFQSFILPLNLKSISLQFKNFQCYLWIPCDESNIDAPSLVLCGDYDVKMSISSCTAAIGSRPFEIDARLCNGQLSLIKAPIGCQQSDILPAEGNVKPIIMPCSIGITVSSELSEINNVTQSCFVSQTISAVIDPIDISLYLDYRVFLTMYEKTFSPLRFLSGLSWGPKSNVGQSFPAADSSSHFTVLSNIMETLPHFGKFSLTNFQIDQCGISVTLWNDVYAHPFPLYKFHLKKSHSRGKIYPTSFLFHYDINSEYYLPLTSKRSPSNMSRYHSIVETLTPKTSTSSLDNTKSSNLNHEDVADKLVSLFSELNISIDYHNHDLMSWEPFLEPTIFSIRCTVPKAPSSRVSFCILGTSTEPCEDWNHFVDIGNENAILNRPFQLPEISKMHSTIVHNNIYSSEINRVKESFAMNAKMKLSVHISSSVNINLSFAHFDSLAQIVQSVQKMNSYDWLMKKSEEKIPVLQEDISVIMIRNDSGISLAYWTDDMPSMITVPVNSTLPMNIDYSRLFDINRKNDMSRRISIGLPVFGPTHYSIVDQISIDGSNSHFYPLHESVVNMSDSRKPPVITGDAFVNIELGTENGLRILSVSSSLKITNNTSLPVRVFIKDPKSRLEWDDVVDTDSYVHVPVQFCQSEYVNVLISPLIINRELKDAILDIYGCNPFLVSGQQSDMDSATRRKVLDEALLSFKAHLVGDNSAVWTQSDASRRDSSLFACNSISWREDESIAKKKEKYVKSYSHWLYFPSSRNLSNHSKRKFNKEIAQAAEASFNTRFNFNARISTSSSFLSGEIYSMKESSHHLKEIVLTSPVRVINAMACGLEVALFRESDFDCKIENVDVDIISKRNASIVINAPKMKLCPGEEWKCVDFHSIESFGIAFMIDSPNSSSRCWSSMIVVHGCQDESSNRIQTQTAFVKFDNGSLLSILVEIDDRFGDRILTIYTPFWVVSSSIFDIQYQQDTSLSSFNGIDGLCADQVFLRPSILNEAGNMRTKLNRVRGVNGVILAPDFPTCGIAGARFRSRMKSSDMFSNRMKGFSKEDDSNFEQESSILDTQTSENTEVSYSLIQCGFADGNTCRLKLRCKGCDWSRAVSLDSLKHSVVDVYSSRHEEEARSSHYASRSVTKPTLRSGNQVFSFGLQSFPADGPFHRTKIIVINDRFCVNNRTDHSIEVCQADIEDESSLTAVMPSQTVPMWWRNDDRYLKLRLAKNGWSWSGRFKADVENEIYLRMRNDHDKSIYFLLIKIIKYGPNILLAVEGGENIVAPYRIENHSLHIYRIKQTGTNLYTQLIPYHASLYSWDEPHLDHVCVLEKQVDFVNGLWKSMGEYRLDLLQSYSIAENLVIRIVSEGPTRIMQIYDSRTPPPVEMGQSLPYGSTFSGDSIQDYSTFVNNRLDIRYGDYLAYFQMKIHVSSIGISVIDHTPEEIVFVSLGNLSLSYVKGSTFDRIHAQVGALQIDNQLDDSPIFPSLVHSSKQTLIQHANRSTGFGSNKPQVFANIDIIRNFSFPNVSYFPLFRVRLAPLYLNVEGNLIVKLIEFGKSIVEIFQNEKVGKSRIVSRNVLEFAHKRDHEWDLRDSSKRVVDPIVAKLLKSVSRTISMESIVGSPVVFCKHLDISDVQVYLSLDPSIDYRSLMFSESIVANTLCRIAVAVVSTVSKLDHCPIYFKGKILSHSFMNASDGFVTSLTKHYSTQVVQQAARVILSLGILGNPLDIGRNIRNSAMNMIALPMKGISDSSLRNFFGGLVFGSCGFVGSVFASICNSIVQISASLQSGMITLGVVEMAENRKKKLSLSNSTVRKATANAISLFRPENIWEGIKLAFIGALRDPLYGFSQRGFQGLLAGILQGSLGILIRPTFGGLQVLKVSLQRLSRFIAPKQSLLCLETQQIPRVRSPREFSGHQNHIEIYSLGATEGRKMLGLLSSRTNKGLIPSNSDNSIQIWDERYKWHGFLCDGNIIMVSSHRVVEICQHAIISSKSNTVSTSTTSLVSTSSISSPPMEDSDTDEFGGNEDLHCIWQCQRSCILHISHFKGKMITTQQRSSILQKPHVEVSYFVASDPTRSEKKEILFFSDEVSMNKFLENIEIEF